MTAEESRARARHVYTPEPVRGMAHRSYRSPDGKWVLLAEMDAGWLPCRAVPFDGSSAGRVVGPPQGRCTYAAWSPDGQWMYFSSDASGTMQIWRQRFPDGSPEQLTSGPTAAEGLAVDPDGRSLVTSLGMDQRSVWLHENSQDRQISSEGSAMLPAWGDGFPTSVFSPDGKKLYYLRQTGPLRSFGSGELWVSDLETGANEALLPGLTMTTFDLSPDGRRVIFAAVDEERKTHIWLASVDRRSPPRPLPSEEGRGPVFANDNEAFFRGPAAGQWFLYRIKLDSGQIEQFATEPAVNSPIVSPDGQWVVSWTPQEDPDDAAVVKAYPTEGGAPVAVCVSCFVKWTRDRRSLFLSFLPGNFMGNGRTFVIALPPGKALPALPPKGIRSESDLRALPVVGVIDLPNAFPGLSASTYAFEKQFVQRNLYRISIP